jgi:purine-binding chemotaxis protein CheW
MASWNEPTAREWYLAFRAGSGEYALGILAVKEILPAEEILPATSTSPAIRGVLSYYGIDVPVVDLAVKMGLPSPPATRHTCVLLVESPRAVPALTALLVDAVTELVELGPGEIEAPPASGSGAAGLVGGSARVGARVVHLLDIERMYRPPAGDGSSPAAR